MGYKVVVLILLKIVHVDTLHNEFIQAKYDDEKALNQLGQNVM